jgi:hypothetical protein
VAIRETEKVMKVGRGSTLTACAKLTLSWIRGAGSQGH